MAWTAPRTWIAGELLTAALFNSQFRDNQSILKTSISNDGGTWTGAVNGTSGTFSGPVTFSSTVNVQNGNGSIRQHYGANYWLIYHHSDNSLRWSLDGAGADEMVLKSNGYLGLGVSPGHPLHVSTSLSGDWVAHLLTSGASPLGLLVAFTALTNATTNYFFYCTENAGATLRFNVMTNGGISNYSTNNVNLSDLGAKDITGPAPSQRGKIRRIAMYRGRYKDSKRGHDDLMWGAQDIEKIDPEWVDVWQEEQAAAPAVLDKDGKEIKPAKPYRPRLLGTRDHLIFMANVAAVAELDHVVEDLAARVAALEG